MKFYAYLYFLLLALIPCLLPAQEQGKLFITNYGVDQYKGHPQNFDLIQNKDQLVFIGNNAGGVVVYDGRRWTRVAETPRGVRNLATDYQGRVYVGGDPGIGYIEKNDSSQLRYHSLAPFIDSAYTSGTIWHIHVAGPKVYFFSNETLFIWDGQQMNYVPLGNSFYRSFWVNDVLYLDNKRHNELYRLNGDQLEKIELKNKLFAGRIAAMLPYKNKQILIVSRYEGLFVFNPEQQSIRPLDGTLHETLKKDRINSAIFLKDNTLALGSAYNGLHLADYEGNWRATIGKKEGLADQTIWNLKEDFTGNLWAATNNGIAKIEYANGLTFWDESTGLAGVTLGMKKIDGELYAATTVGLFRLVNNQFQKIEGINEMCMSLIIHRRPLEERNCLMVGTDRALYEVKEHTAIKIASVPGSCMIQYQKDPSFLYSSDFDGVVHCYQYRNKEWVKLPPIKSLLNSGLYASSLTEDKHGNLWIGTEGNGVFRLEQINDPEQLQITHFDKSKGLPENTAYSVGLLDKELILYSQKGFYSLNTSPTAFKLDTALTFRLGFTDLHPNIYPFTQSPSGDVWMYSNNEPGNKIIGAVKAAEHGYTIDTTSLKRVGVNTVASIYAEEEGPIWVSSPGMIHRYNPDQKIAAAIPYSAIINQIHIGKDSVLYDGHIDANAIAWKQITTLDYINNSIRFNFGASNYSLEEQTQFSYRLEGFDDQWSGWTTDQYKEYNNLEEGTYTFQLKSLNIYGQESQTCQYSFEVNPPWYRTFWAYLLYCSLGGLLINGIARYYSAHLKKENESLEATIRDRTEEVEQQRKILEKSNVQLKKTIKKLQETQSQLVQSERLASLGQLTAGIAHEINNPINFVASNVQALKLDFEDLQQLLKKVTALRANGHSETAIKEVLQLDKQLDTDYIMSEVNSLIDGIERGAVRTQNIVNSLRTFSRNTTEEFLKSNIEEGLDSTLTILNSRIAHRVKVIKDYGQVPLVNCQISKLNQVFLNLINNAIQAIDSRPEGQQEEGTIRISTAQEEEQIIISIQDNGIGMSEEVRSKIFEPFYTTKDVGEGTGLGLAISYGIIADHQGNINVESKPGEGTCFRITLPMNYTPEK